MDTLELTALQQHIDTLANIKHTNSDKVHAYQHKMLQLLLQEKTTRGMNEQLCKQLDELEKENNRLRREVGDERRKWESESKRWTSKEERLNE